MARGEGFGIHHPTEKEPSAGQGNTKPRRVVTKATRVVSSKLVVLRLKRRVVGRDVWGEGLAGALRT